MACSGTNGYIKRTAILFDTSPLAGATPSSATLWYKISYQVADPKHPVCFVAAPSLHNPPIPSDYGYLRTTETEICDRIAGDCPARLAPPHALNAAGLANINPNGITCIAVRVSSEIAVQVPPAGKLIRLSLSGPLTAPEVWPQLIVFWETPCP